MAHLWNYVKNTVLAGVMSVSSSCGHLSPEQIRERQDYSNLMRNHLFSLINVDETSEEDKEVLGDIAESIEDKISSQSEKDFLEYKDITEKAYELAGIRNPQRYPLSVLEETVNNLTNPSHREDKPLVLVFMGSYDRDLGLGIRPLEVKSPEIANLLLGYRVIVMESANTEELDKRVTRLLDNYKNSERVVEGIIVGGHGSAGKIALGYLPSENLNPPYIYYIFDRLNKLVSKEAIIFLTPCHAAEGERSIQHAFAYTFPERKVYACPKTVKGLFYSFDSRHRIIPSSLQLVSSLAQSDDCTYVEQWKGSKKERVREFYTDNFHLRLSDIKYLEEQGIKNYFAISDFRNIPLAEDILEFLKKKGISVKETGYFSPLLVKPENWRTISDVIDSGITSPKEIFLKGLRKIYGEEACGCCDFKDNLSNGCSACQENEMPNSERGRICIRKIMFEE